MTTTTMTTTIIVHTPAADAVRTCSQSGWHPLSLDLTTWTDAEREALARAIVDTPRGPKLLAWDDRILRGAPRSAEGEQLRNQWYAAIAVAPPTEARLRALVTEALVADTQAAVDEAAKQAEARAAEERRREQRRQRMLLAPVAELVRNYGTGWRACDDIPPERLAEAEAEAERLNAELRRIVEDEKAQVAADRATLRALLEDRAPQLVSVWEDGRARSRDITPLVEAAVATLLDLGTPCDYPHTEGAHRISAAHHDLWKRAKAAADAATELRNIMIETRLAYADEDEDEPSIELVEIRGKYAGIGFELCYRVPA